MSWDTTFYTKKAEICTLGSFEFGTRFFDPQEVTKDDVETMLASCRYSRHLNNHVKDLEMVKLILRVTEEKVYAKTL